jgi:hypothetical protein
MDGKTRVKQRWRDDNKNKRGPQNKRGAPCDTHKLKKKMKKDFLTVLHSTREREEPDWRILANVRLRLVFSGICLLLVERKKPQPQTNRKLFHSFLNLTSIADGVFQTKISNFPDGQHLTGLVAPPQQPGILLAVVSSSRPTHVCRFFETDTHTHSHTHTH